MRRKILVQIPKNEADQFFDSETYESLRQLGEIVWNPYNRPWTSAELKEQIRDADAVITTWRSAPICDEIYEAAEKLQLIAHMAGSVKPVVTTMRVYDDKLTVLNSNYAIAVSVSESVLAMILALGHKIIPVDQAMKCGAKWKLDNMETYELRGRTVGLVGLGMVAREVIKVLQPFDVRILGYDPFVSEQTAEELGVELQPLHDLIAKSDIVSLHAPKIPETYQLIGAKELSLLRDGAMLINTARGDLLDQDALIEELKSGRFYAGLDVYVEEPLPPDHPLRRMDNVIARPHLAGVNPNSRRRIGKLMVEEMHRLYNKQPLRFEVRKEQLANMT